MWQPFPPLFERFLAGDRGLDTLFGLRRDSVRDWARRLERLGGFPEGRRERIARALESHNTRIGAGGPSVRLARSLASRETVAVVAGQQAGVLTGPLYTIYKAITVIRVARWAEEELGCSVVPVFWVASDDHDFDEIASISAMNDRGLIRRLRLQYRPPAPDSVANIAVPRAARTLVGDLETFLGGGAAAMRDLSVRVLADADRSSSVADWFGRLLARLFRDIGLVVIDPGWPELRESLGPFFQQALLHSRTVTAELSAAAERLEVKGFRAGLDLDRDHSHLFLRRGGQRMALIWRDGRLTDRAGRLDRPLDAKEAVRIAVESPGDLSPNVVLRPIAQEHLLPVLAHVAGPGEVGYLSQMRQVYPLFGQEMPVIVPRLSATLVEPDQAETMERFGLSPSDVPGLLEERLLAQLHLLDDVGIEDMFDGMRSAIAGLYEERLPGLQALNQGLGRLGRTNMELVLGQVEYLEQKALQHRRRRHRGLVDSFRRLEGLLPQGRPQEQVFNIFPYLASYGRRLIEDLLTLPVDAGHVLAYIEAGRQ